MNTTTTNLIDAARNYYVFQCITINDEQRPNGKKITEGCGRWCMKSSVHPLRYLATDEYGQGKEYITILQGSCPNHPENKSGRRKQRLNEDRLNIKTFTSRKDALFCIDLLNEVVEETQPNEKPQGMSLHDIEIPSNPLGSSPTDWNWERMREARIKQNKKIKDAEDEAEEMYWIDVAKGLI